MLGSWNYIRPSEGNHEADVALGEDEFDTPGLDYSFNVVKQTFVL